MDGTQRLNRISGTVLIVLSLTALAPLLVVALPAILTGRVARPEPDETTSAHIFQLSIVALEHVYLPGHGYPAPRPGLPLHLLRQVLSAVR